MKRWGEFQMFRSLELLLQRTLDPRKLFCLGECALPCPTQCFHQKVSVMAPLSQGCEEKVEGCPIRERIRNYFPMRALGGGVGVGTSLHQVLWFQVKKVHEKE